MQRCVRDYKRQETCLPSRTHRELNENVQPQQDVEMALAKYSSPLDYTLVKWRDGQSTSAVCTSNSPPPLQQHLDSIIAVARLSAAACLSAAASQRAMS